MHYISSAAMLFEFFFIVTSNVSNAIQIHASKVKKFIEIADTKIRLKIEWRDEEIERTYEWNSIRLGQNRKTKRLENEIFWTAIFL